MSDLVGNPEDRYSRVAAHIVILGYAGVYIVFLFLLQNIDCGYSLESSRFLRVPTIYVLSKNKKNIKKILLKIFIL